MEEITLSGVNLDPVGRKREEVSVHPVCSYTPLVDSLRYSFRRSSSTQLYLQDL